MAGHYQGTHLLGDVGGRDHRSIEVFWKHDGWFWWPRHGYAVGPSPLAPQPTKTRKRQRTIREGALPPKKADRNLARSGALGCAPFMALGIAGPQGANLVVITLNSWLRGNALSFCTVAAVPQ